MNEKDLDSSANEYEETHKPKNYVKQLEWDMAIGLQQVDNLKPSKYFEELTKENVIGNLTIEEVKNVLKSYYTEKENKNEVDYSELECDFVSTRIVELLQEDKFELSVDYLKYIHKYLFQDVYKFAGEFRKINFSKHEKILNNDSVAYGDYKKLTDSLEYDILLEKEKNYKEMSIVEVINNITKFSSSIWQVHPFREGNTRTVALFIEKYLISLGYTVDKAIFKEKSVYFRNALVRSNYFNSDLNIKEDSSYLIKFYENLLLGKNNNLNLKELKVKELFLMEKSKRVREYFDLGNQYIKSSIYLMSVICENGNETSGISNYNKSAEDLMMKNSDLSDTTLFIPAIFDCYHGVELYIKGLLILKNKDFSKSHSIKDLIDLLEIDYKDTNLHTLIYDFYFKQIELIQEYKTSNSINDDEELYMSLRYPENKSGSKIYDKYTLKYNGALGIEQMKKIKETLELITQEVLKVYHNQI